MRKTRERSQDAHDNPATKSGFNYSRMQDNDMYDWLNQTQPDSSMNQTGIVNKTQDNYRNNDNAPAMGSFTGVSSLLVKAARYRTSHSMEKGRHGSKPLSGVLLVSSYSRWQWFLKGTPKSVPASPLFPKGTQTNTPLPQGTPRRWHLRDGTPQTPPVPGGTGP